MKKKILIFLLLGSFHCRAHTFFDIITHKIVSHSGLSSFMGYDDFYFYKNSAGVKNYCNRHSGGINFSSGTPLINNYRIELNDYAFFVNDLNALEDRVLFDLKGIKGVMESKYKNLDFGFSLQFVESDLNYQINEFSDAIPLSYFQSFLKMKYQDFELSMSALKGNESEADFNNEIRGFSSGILIEKPFKNIVFSLTGFYTNFSLDLKKNNSAFCELNGFQTLQYSCSGSYQINPNIKMKGGMMGIRTWQKARSFLDAEPFIGYYSLFFGSKTFIKKLNIGCISPFISYNHNVKIFGIPISASLDYYHLFAYSDIIYTERIWLIPGIWPDDTKQHKLDINPDVDGIFKLQFEGEMTYKKFVFNIIGSQLLPVNYSRLGKPSQPSAGDKKAEEHGGTSVTVLIGYQF